MSIEKRKYVGARYVPLFSTPLEWSNTREYEPLTVVLNEGNSYTSRQFVPAGIDISNESYWALTGNYNAQVEQYRQEVQAFDGRITKNAQDITAINQKLTKNDQVITAINQKITKNAQDITAINQKLSEKPIMVVIGDSYTQQSNWISRLANTLDMTVTNYGVGGAQFHDWGTGVSFLNQLQKAKSELDITKIGLILFCGGINDLSNDTAKGDLLNNVTTFSTYFKNNFPGVNMLANVCYCTPKYLANDTVILAKGAEGRMIALGIGVVKNAWMTFNMYRGAYISSDEVHPTDAGYGIIYARNINAISGDDNLSVSLGITPSSSAKVTNALLTVSQTNTSFVLTATVVTEGTSVEVGTIPLFLPYTPYPCIMVTTTGTMVPVMLTTSGTNTVITLKSDTTIAAGTAGYIYIGLAY